jgi:C-terminal processing protease CtpA/Prc
MASTSNSAKLLRQAKIRLCRLYVWSNYEGLGFGVESSSQPPYPIQTIESNSPAVAGGLRMYDVILAVNNQDVSETDYKKLIKYIKDVRDSKNYV